MYIYINKMPLEITDFVHALSSLAYCEENESIGQGLKFVNDMLCHTVFRWEAPKRIFQSLWLLL